MSRFWSLLWGRLAYDPSLPDSRFERMLAARHPKASSHHLFRAPILRQSGPVKGAGRHSIVQIPSRDEWVIAYHRFRIPDGNGYNRETCLSPMRHAEDGRILPVDVFETAILKGSASVAPQPAALKPVTTVSVDLSQAGRKISPDLPQVAARSHGPPRHSSAEVRREFPGRCM
ncbi:MAG: family 43 glycosylhydrolase [Verrucomicrobiia bacterium]